MVNEPYESDGLWAAAYRNLNNQKTDEVKEKIAAELALMNTEPVCEAAKALCRARCALFDRDPNCQETGRCGTNWEWYKAVALRSIRKPVI